MRHAKVLTLVLILELLALETVSAQDPEWRKIRPRFEAFTVEMPGVPTRVNWIIPVETSEQLTPIVFDLVHNGVRYQILSFDRDSRLPKKERLKAFVEKFQRAVVRGNDRQPNSLTFEKDIVGKNPGMQFQLKVGNHDGVVRLYDGAEYLYAVMIIGSGESDPTVSRFLNSFKLSRLNTELTDESSGNTPQPKEPSEPWSASSQANLTPFKAGVLNRKAEKMAFAKYPNKARESQASGTVVVQVLVNEQGEVIAAIAIDGPEVLREAATEAAVRTRFSQTLLMGQPVKVLGVLQYRFVYGP